MHAKEELIEQLGETYGYISHLFDQKIEEYKLAAAEKSALTFSKVLTAIVMTILLVIMVTFGLISLAFSLAGDMPAARGFGIVALIMLVLMIIVFLLRRYLIVNPAVTKTISLFFAESDKKADHE